jgi:hypothetical protein
MRKHLAIAACAGTLALSSWAAIVVSVTFNGNTSPAGTHLSNGSPAPNCTVDGLTVTCNAYQLAGVGNTNSTLNMEAEYTADVECTNHGRQLVEVKTHVRDGSDLTIRPERRNGEMRVPAVTATATNAEFLAQADCPNGNWTPTLKAGTPTLTSFTYTLTFDGFATAVTITGP